jgi:hypothetical protein
VAGAFSPHTGSYYLYSDRSDQSYKRLMRTVDITGVNAAELSFFASWDTELDWDSCSSRRTPSAKRLDDAAGRRSGRRTNYGHWDRRIVPSGLAHFLDDITVSTEAGTESFETGLGAWTVAGPMINR